jgi:opacity protein-like surface antigen
MKPAFLLAAAIALAPAASGAADNGFYLGAGIGDANTEVDDVFDSGFSFDESNFGFKLFAGYKFLPWLGVEGIYLDGGNPELSVSDEAGVRETLSVKVQSLIGTAVLAWPVTQSFEVFLKPGVVYWNSSTDYRITAGDQSGGFDDDDSGAGLFLGAGVGYTVGRAGLRLEYEWFDVEPEFGSGLGELDASTTFLSLSAVYLF